MFTRTNFITALVVVAVALSLLMPERNSSQITASPPTQNETSLISGSQTSRSQSSGSQDESLVIQNVKVYDMDGRLAYEGNVDLSPELARILAGRSDPHDNDGGIFSNREGLLPKQERGYYKEYVVRTQSINHAGPQRLILGEAGEVYYTPDHYSSFQKIK